jgi:hypothetical protein
LVELWTSGAFAHPGLACMTWVVERVADTLAGSVVVDCFNRGDALSMGGAL